VTLAVHLQRFDADVDTRNSPNLPERGLAKGYPTKKIFFFSAYLLLKR